MSPNDVKVALNEVLRDGVSLNTGVYILLFSSWLASLVIGAFTEKYWGKRGETAAISRDLAEIKRQLRETTTLTEKIRADISGNLWLKQRHWDLKRECYSNLAEHFGHLATSLQEVINWRMAEPSPGTDVEKLVADRQQKANTALEAINRWSSIARIVVAPDVRTFLSSFGTQWNGIGLIEQQQRVAHDAWVRILDLARVDLLSEPSEFVTDGRPVVRFQ
jgi:hypothetical protein